MILKSVNPYQPPSSEILNLESHDQNKRYSKAKLVGLVTGLSFSAPFLFFILLAFITFLQQPQYKQIKFISYIFLLLPVIIWIICASIIWASKPIKFSVGKRIIQSLLWSTNWIGITFPIIFIFKLLRDDIIVFSRDQLSEFLLPLLIGYISMSLLLCVAGSFIDWQINKIRAET